MTLEKQILERIKNQGVKPTPKGFFKARDYTLWVLLGLFVAAVSLGIGMIIFMVKGADLDVLEKLGLSTPEKIAYSIPVFWIAATLILGAIAYFNFRSTRRGYRVPTRQFVLVSAGIALALGSVIYASNITSAVDDVAAKNVPLYNAVVPLNTHTWLDPDHGLLSGTVREKDSDNNFKLRDSSAELWTVEGENIFMPANFEFHPGDRIKIIGTKTADDQFKAIEIRPWE